MGSGRRPIPAVPEAEWDTKCPIYSSVHIFVVYKVLCPLSTHFLPAWKTQRIIILTLRVICAHTLDSFVLGIAYVLHA